MGFFSVIIGLILAICFVIACCAVERTKNETIKIHELLININKIEIARYKKEFNIQDKTNLVDASISLSDIPASTIVRAEE